MKESKATAKFNAYLELQNPRKNYKSISISHQKYDRPYVNLGEGVGVGLYDPKPDSIKKSSSGVSIGFAPRFN